MSFRALASVFLALLFLCSCHQGNSDRGPRPDPAIYDELSHVPAIDNHAHPVKVLSPGEVDGDVDALPTDAISDLALPTPMLENSPYIPEAWRGLFGYGRSGASRGHSKELSRKKLDIQKSKGDS